MSLHFNDCSFIVIDFQAVTSVPYKDTLLAAMSDWQVDKFGIET